MPERGNGGVSGEELIPGLMPSEVLG